MCDDFTINYFTGGINFCLWIIQWEKREFCFESNEASWMPWSLWATWPWMMPFYTRSSNEYSQYKTISPSTLPSTFPVQHVFFHHWYLTSKWAKGHIIRKYRRAPINMTSALNSQVISLLSYRTLTSCDMQYLTSIFTWKFSKMKSY